ncbi:glycosyltransferase family 2 protein [Brevibacillus fluminis]|uniref:glycosyltransferase family 2 protein n=1 Tax=Brevibacillus fluminis TaxID=511487 RepID=UPI003F8B9E8D
MAKTSVGGQGSRVGVSVVTCTNRPQFFRRLLENYQNQMLPHKELIIILNNDRMNLRQYRALVGPMKNVSVYQLPQSFSLGRCLNFGVRQARYPFVAKFDDDDYYGPHYLVRQLRALVVTKAHVVGKLAHFLYLKGRQLLVLQLPHQGNRFVNWIAGGTIMARRSLFLQVPFPDRSLGEDVGFLRKCRARGLRIYASDHFDYVYIRRPNKNSHTWKVADRELMNRKHIVIGHTTKYKAIARRRLQPRSRVGPLPHMYVWRAARVKA